MLSQVFLIKGRRDNWKSFREPLFLLSSLFFWLLTFFFYIVFVWKLSTRVPIAFKAIFFAWRCVATRRFIPFFFFFFFLLSWNRKEPTPFKCNNNTEKRGKKKSISSLQCDKMLWGVFLQRKKKTKSTLFSFFFYKGSYLASSLFLFFVFWFDCGQFSTLPVAFLFPFCPVFTFERTCFAQPAAHIRWSDCATGLHSPN